MRKRGFIREAEGAINGVRRCSHFKPLQQRYDLRVIRKVKVFFFNGDRYRGFRQHLNRVSFFQVTLTGRRIGWLAGELPDRSVIVNKGIGKCLGGFMRECGHILESSAENSRRNPTRELGDPARLRNRSWVFKKSMETEYAAAPGSIR